MHPLRVIVILSIAVAAAVAIAFGAALRRSGTHLFPAVVISAAAFVIYLLPALAAFAWAMRRASDLDLLTDRVRRVAEGHQDVIADRTFHGEVDELARAAEELRSIIA